MKNIKDKVFISGCAGFIGAAITKKLLNNGYGVIGIDNLNSYYDKNLKLLKETSSGNSFGRLFEVTQ